MNVPIDWPEVRAVAYPMGIEETFTPGSTPHQTYVSTPIRRNHRRLLLGLLVAFTFVIEGQLIYLQIFRAQMYRQVSESNRALRVTIEAPRGAITDRNNIILASNVPSSSLFVNRDQLNRSETRELEIVRLSQLLGLEQEELVKAIEAVETTGNAATGVLLTNDQALSLRVYAQEFPHFTVKTTQTRRYHHGARALSVSHILGYIGRPTADDIATRGIATDGFIGRSGIERVMDSALRGTNGWRAYEVDARGRKGQLRESRPPVIGNDIRLSIDLGLQEASERALRAVLASTRAPGGVVVALEPTTGEILTLVSLPTYDNNVFTQPGRIAQRSALLQERARPLFHRAVLGLYPSGSTIKPLIAAIALEEKAISPSTTIVSTGGIRVGAWFFPDWKSGGHGPTNLKRALSESVNTYFYTIVGGSTAVRTRGALVPLGIAKATDGLRRLGWGRTTGVELGDESGLIPTPAWKSATRQQAWYIGDTYHVAIGQGDILVTPLQVAAAYALLANGGYQVRPTLIAGRSPSTIANDTPRLLTASTVDAVSEGLAEVVRTGSARRLGGLPFTVLAKTGTAQTSSANKQHSWLAAIGASKEKKLVLVVLVEEGGEGSASATTVALDVLQWWGRSQTGKPSSG